MNRQAQPSSSSACSTDGFICLARRAATVLFVAGVLYALLLGLHLTFPYYGEGGRVVTAEKYRHLSRPGLLPSTADRRVVIFGNSKVLCGFIPDLFDELSEGRVFSYNLGLPNADEFVSVLARLIEAGNVPTDILITIRWSEEPPRNPLVFVHDDEAMLFRLVPFRHLLRDGAIFLRRSLERGGPLALYRETRRDSQEIIENRGYYFIAGQSRFPGDRLPDDYRLETDQPHVARPRQPPSKGAVFARLEQLLEEHDIRAWLVPTYYREGEYMAVPDSPNPALVDAFADHPRIRVLGPDYMLYPNALFSDRLHVNREGAREYTALLWRLFEPSAAFEVP